MTPELTQFYREYLAVGVFVLAAFLMVGAMLTIARLLRPTLPQEDKYVTYESGSDPLPLFGQTNVRWMCGCLFAKPPKQRCRSPVRRSQRRTLYSAVELASA